LLSKSQFPIFAPFLFADNSVPLSYTVRETMFTVEFEISIFGLEVKGVQFANRSLTLTLGQLSTLSQARFHVPMGPSLPTTLVFTAPDGFADAINFVPNHSVLLVRFGRQNPQ